MLLNDRTHYKRNLLVAVIVSELLIICAFLFSPGFSITEDLNSYNEPLILIDDIPQTVQNRRVKKQKPEIPIIIISDAIDAFEMLEDVRLESNLSNQTVEKRSGGFDTDDIFSRQSTPRLTLEVLPAVDGIGYEGQLKLSLKINEKGEVIDHEIIFNSLDCTYCLNQIIIAAYKSKWEPAVVNGKKSDYWIEKSYIFN